jgi:hypothetical protein
MEHIAKNGWNFKAIKMAMKVANFNGNGRTKVEVLVHNYDIDKTLFD